ncbi:MAG: hypothetical protein KatS3mg061_2198 [Dehalococcoidia bacterium]|nr:MAG: hypothetical protein KatS3mg061_2198 [Dehalococcoidia bacterium]
MALLNAAKALDSLKLEGDEQVGVNILRRALEEPLRQLVANAGLEGSVIVEHVREMQRQKGSPNWGFDVTREDYVDMLAAGIIDPAKVTRTALENGASIAGMILTTEALVTEVKEKEKTPAPPAPEY